MKLQPLVIVVSSIFLLTLVASSCGDATTPTKQYTITFVTNDGSAVAPIKVAEGSKATKPADPTKTNSVFVGWYKEAALTNLFDFNTAITQNTTLYAKFEELPKYTVSFNTDGGSTIASQSVYQGKLATKPADPTKTNYNFVGWYKEAAFTTPFNFSTDVINAATTLYAKFEELPKFTVTFYTGGGSTVPAQSGIYQGKLATKPVDPTLTDFIFAGWYKESSFTNKFDFNMPITGNTDVYARWVNKDIEGIAVIGTVPADLTGYDQVSRDVLQYHKAGANVVATYVKVGGTGNGKTWATARASVKEALDAITPTDTVHLVLVAKGTYQAGSAMKMKNNVAIIGGWPAVGEWTRNAADTTVLSGNKSYGVFDNTYEATALLTNTAVLYGAKVMDGSSGYGGGGMANTYASPVVMNVTFSGNTAIYRGGGMYNTNSSPILTNVTFSSNIATSGSDGGGGMDNNNSSPVLTNVTFSANNGNGTMVNNNSSPVLTNVMFSANGCGGMVNNSSSPVLTNVTFSNNTANGDGGGMSNVSSSPVLINVTFSGNTTEVGYGGGMSNVSSSPVLINVTFSGNTVQYRSGGGMYNDNSSPVITNSIFWGNVAPTDSQYTKAGTSIYNSVVQGYSSFAGGVPTNNNVKINPLLEDGLTAYGGYVQVFKFTGNSPVNIGLYVKRSGSTHYYSSDKQTWFSNQALTTAATPPADAVDLTATDAGGQPRIGAPDAGAWEKP